MAFWSASQLARYFRQMGDVARARACADEALVVVRDAMERDPKEPAYQRWAATAVAQAAADQAAGGDLVSAGASLRESVDTFRSLHDAWPNAAREADLESALGDALAHAGSWQLGRAAPVAAWRSQLAQLRTVREGLEKTAREIGVPASGLYPAARALRSLQISRGTGELNGKPGSYLQLEPPADWDKETRTIVGRVLTRHGYEWSRLLLPGGRGRGPQWKGYWERWQFEAKSRKAPARKSAKKPAKSPSRKSEMVPARKRAAARRSASPRAHQSAPARRRKTKSARHR
jgi:hypothetical protein